MPKKGFIPNKLKPWIEARARFKLSHDHVQMARELGMNPKKLGSIANHKSEPWKVPLPEFIVHCYEKQFKRPALKGCKPIEQVDAEKRAQKALKKQEKLAAKQEAELGELATELQSTEQT